MYKVIALFVFYFAVLQTLAQEQAEISVYYESLCPDSIRFITRQLYPTYKELGASFNVNFVPYGKATHNLGSNGWEFECQHGEAECFGNKYQACALAQNYDEATNVEYINCVMSQSNPAAFQTIYLCAVQVGLDFNVINNCFNTNGDDILAELGDQTHAVEPTITFVPTVIYNGVFNQEFQDLAQTNFKLALCNALSTPPPAACLSNKMFKPKFPWFFLSHVPDFRHKKISLL